jgi:hypothetical protein
VLAHASRQPAGVHGRLTDPEKHRVQQRHHAEPGIERILNRIRPKPDRPVRATLRLPAVAPASDLEALLYQHWPLKRERRLYERLRVMDLKFEFTE